MRTTLVMAVVLGAGCGRTILETTGDLELLGVVGCDGVPLEPGAKISADRDVPPRLAFAVRANGSLAVRGPYRLHYQLVFDRIGFGPADESDDASIDSRGPLPRR
jgi:hypothetical protein